MKPNSRKSNQPTYSMKNIPQSRLRKLRTWIPSKTPAILESVSTNEKHLSLIDLASNDYLGLSTNPKIISAVNQSIKTEGIGAGASRLVTGSRQIHKRLETALSEWLNREYVLLFPSGFQANIAAVMALADRHTIVIADKFIHYSLLIGVKTSGAKLKRFIHNNLNDLEAKLKRCSEEQPNLQRLVMTESLFSMEGTSPDLEKMAALCNEYGAKLLVDEAHSLGIMGYEGRGLAFKLKDNISLISGTFGKAFGSGGAFLAADKEIGESLIQNSGCFRYTTALAPPLAAAAFEALNIIKANPKWGENLQRRSLEWRSALKENGWSYPKGNGPIISLLLGSDQKALNYQNQLEEKGLLSIAIRPPTVPEGKSRLRIVVRKGLPKGTLEKFLDAVGKP